MFRFAIPTAAGLLLVPGVAAAHPGHGAEAGLVHYLTDPFHLAGLLLVATAGAILVGLAARFARRFAFRARRTD